MSETDLVQQMQALKEKLLRTERRLAGLKEKSKHLEMQYDDSRTREANSHELVMELIERQRELNVMLNRANIMLNRTQEAMALTSMEFNEMAKALPEPKKAEWSERVAKINDLFKKTGVQDAEMLSLDSPNPEVAESLDTDELKKESEKSFGRKEALWQRLDRHEPTRVEAIPVEDEAAPEEPESPAIPEITIHHPDSGEEDAGQSDDAPRRRSWWQRRAG